MYIFSYTGIFLSLEQIKALSGGVMCNILGLSWYIFKIFFCLDILIDAERYSYYFKYVHRLEDG